MFLYDKIRKSYEEEKNAAAWEHFFFFIEIPGKICKNRDLVYFGVFTEGNVG